MHFQIKIGLLQTIFLLLSSAFFGQSIQIENLLVERYYVSDAADATDTDGGALESASVTYRVYLDLSSGMQLKQLFGNTQHPFAVHSTADFFNNWDRGKTLGSEINDARLDENTVALDSWLTISMASDAHLGILKESDPNGSIVGGLNNDGGSESIPGGLLINDSPDVGLPLTLSDGLIAITGEIPQLNLIEGSTVQGLDEVFGVNTLAGSFISDDLRIESFPPQSGADSENRVLIAQFTTAGDLSFSMNVILVDSEGSAFEWVADSLDTVHYSPFLTYPLVNIQCGCSDPYFLEYDPSALCADNSLCSTPIVIGCTDLNACNYDLVANFNYPALCCYSPDSCGAGLNFYAICDPLSIEENDIDISVYPVPSSDVLYIQIPYFFISKMHIDIADAHGRIVESNDKEVNVNGTLDIDISRYPNGVYFINVQVDDRVLRTKFMKMEF